MPENTDDEVLGKMSFWKSISEGMEWCTDQSPYFNAIKTGIISANGNFPVTVTDETK